MKKEEKIDAKLLKKVKIELENREIKLLLTFLKEAENFRSDMGCNDPYKSEEKMFTKEERKSIMKEYLAEDYDYGTDEELFEDLDGFMYNCNYVTYLLKKIKKQVKNW